jgi:hypothetical protein
MMDRSVPIRISPCSGTGTVMVVPAVRFCMTAWLPRCLSSSKQFETVVAEQATQRRSGEDSKPNQQPPQAG